MPGSKLFRYRLNKLLYIVLLHIVKHVGCCLDVEYGKSVVVCSIAHVFRDCERASVLAGELTGTHRVIAKSDS